MKKSRGKILPLIASGIVPSAVLPSALLTSPAAAAPGDLDPAFGDVGRLGPILDSAAWSVEPQDDGLMLLGGGRPGYSYWGYYAPVGFVNLFTPAGMQADGFDPAVLEDVQVLDVLRQPDGQIIAVGRKHGDPDVNLWQVVVARLQSNGQLDPAFANDGVFLLSGEDHGYRQFASSVVLDPDGRIVVAGSRDDDLLVLRLLPDGSLDTAFGESGVFIGPVNRGYYYDNAGATTSLLRTAGGGYRLTVSNDNGCQLVALTAGGAIDDGFGIAGVATAAPPSGGNLDCNDVASQAGGGLVLVGQTGGRGFASRLRADGQFDAGFAATAVAERLVNATAVVVDDNDRIVVAGYNGDDGAILRLQAGGQVDTQFGNDGMTLIELQTEYGSAEVPRDMKLDANGGVVVAGGDPYSYSAFVARLLPDSGGGSPGVLGITRRNGHPVAEGRDAVFQVRRNGGSSGAVSVAYQVAENSATVGADVEASSGTLTWADGDVAIQEIRVPVVADGEVEGDESFSVALSDVQGGAGLGTTSAFADIEADGKPHGQLGLNATGHRGREGGSAVVQVSREWYGEGEVSVTLTSVAETASTADFASGPVILTWADGDFEPKSAAFAIVDDDEHEDAETFRVELSAPTGGAILGATTSTTVSITDNDEDDSGGGGAFGFLSAYLLGFAAWYRRTVGRKRRS